ncbi:sigma 54-interacting transcriptional regulator [Desulfopila sp. IMCC35008]|uniref:sigma-54 dependent transcriptional regulator n=1 Tax=Desulfopila sp. IMCC35008 TaxID=2653858 RepID=UPI0013D00F40|nr:sigma 54-interacting transcriptional regulator [Desulfopila sp. IMCC35008]
MEKEREDIHILVVDDEESIRYTFKVFLEREGYGKITTAATLEEALAVINEERFDLIISDIVLEDASGTDLLKNIQNTGIQCPVVMITGFPNLDTAANSVRYGAFDYISKPVNKETLLRFVRQALRHWQLDQEKKALQHENEKYRRYLQVIFSSVSDAIVTVDNELNITQYNKAATCWIGDLVSGNSRNLSDLSSEVAQAWLDDARLVIEKRKMVREHQVEYFTPGGEKRMISLTAAPLCDENEEFDGAVIVGRDVTPARPDNSSSNRSSFHGFVGSSPAMLDMYRLIENVGKVDTAVLVTGESGTGKELAAEALHLESMRKDKKLVKVDCAAVAEELLESELFGHRKGAFTGADRDRMGRLLQADKGTLFLDEIGDISSRMQLRLLRFLQEKTFTPVGQDKPVKVNVRIIAATNVDLQDKVRRGEFREDLYYRLKVVEIELPPLRLRPSCIPLLVHHYISYFADRHDLPVYSISDQALKTLCTYHWPGNVRQLRHVIERGCVMCHGATIQQEHLPVEVFDSREPRAQVIVSGESGTKGLHGNDMAAGMISEKEMLLQILARAGGNKSKAARMLGIDRSTLYRKLKRYNVAG